MFRENEEKGEREGGGQMEGGVRGSRAMRIYSCWLSFLNGFGKVACGSCLERLGSCLDGVVGHDVLL